MTLAKPASSLLLGHDTEAQKLYVDWERGEGPSERTFEGGSNFSKEFANSSWTQKNIQIARRDWLKRKNLAGRYTNCCGGMVFAGNTDSPAGQLVGSFRLDAERQGDTILWTATNTISNSSFFAGNILNKVGVPSVPNPKYSPRSNVKMNIHFRTDLNGKVVE